MASPAITTTGFKIPGVQVHNGSRIRGNIVPVLRAVLTGYIQTGKCYSCCNTKKKVLIPLVGDDVALPICQLCLESKILSKSLPAKIDYLIVRNNADLRKWISE